MNHSAPYRLRYPDGLHFLEDFEKNLRYGGCQITGQASPGLFEAVDVLLEVEAIAAIPLRGRVVHELGGKSGFMVQLDGGSLHVQAMLAPVLEKIRDSRSSSVPMPPPGVSRSDLENIRDPRSSSEPMPPPGVSRSEASTGNVTRDIDRRQDPSATRAPETAPRPVLRRPNSGSSPSIESAPRSAEPSFGTSTETDEGFSLESLIKLPPQDAPGTVGPLSDRIRAMTVNEKKRLALSGDRTERMILARDPMVIIQPFLLKNPKISLDEVLFLARYGQANPEALEIIAENKRWVADSRVVLGLVLNPRSPMPMAVRLLDRLPPAELRRIAKRNDLKQPLLQAARKRVLQPD